MGTAVFDESLGCTLWSPWGAIFVKTEHKNQGTPPLWQAILHKIIHSTAQINSVSVGSDENVHTWFSFF